MEEPSPPSQILPFVKTRSAGEGATCHALVFEWGIERQNSAIASMRKRFLRGMRAGRMESDRTMGRAPSHRNFRLFHSIPFVLYSLFMFNSVNYSLQRIFV